MESKNRLFRIDDFYSNSNISLLEENPLIEGKNNKDALKNYLKKQGLKVNVKCSSDNNVHFGITPMIKHNGQILIDGRKRMSWYKVIES